MIISKVQLAQLVPAILAMIFVQQMAIMVQDGHMRSMAFLAIGKIHRRAWTHGRVLLVVAVSLRITWSMLHTFNILYVIEIRHYVLKDLPRKKGEPNKVDPCKGSKPKSTKVYREMS